MNKNRLIVIIALLGAFSSWLADVQLVWGQVPTPTPVTSVDPGLSISLQLIVDELVNPVDLTHAGDGSGRIFIADQVGVIYLIDDGQMQQTPFLDISSKVVRLSNSYDERGLLGLTFHPDYVNNGRFFVYYSAPTENQQMNHKSILAEYHVSQSDVNEADATDERIIMEIEQPQMNHNGGQLAFGPDGYLYVALGDGGGAGDQHGTIGNGQDLTTLLGSILRIDINTGAPYGIPADNPFVARKGLDEIYAYGLRNPWRFSFEPVAPNRLICADVGQYSWEEINIIEKGSNYGWRITEGRHCFNPPTDCDMEGQTMPILEYDHDIGISITGGYFYHGENFPELVGQYVFGDWSEQGVPGGRLFHMQETGTDQWHLFEFQTDGTTGSDFNGYVNSFGLDETGEIYVLSQTDVGPSGSTGMVHKIVSSAPPTSTPTPTEGPEEVPTPTFEQIDYNGDGIIDQADLLVFIDQWHQPDPQAKE